MSDPEVVHVVPVEPAVAPDAPLVKPGWLTSEHAMSYLAMFVSALFAADVIPTSGPISKVAAIAAIMLTNLGYAVSRASVKAAASP